MWDKFSYGSFLNELRMSNVVASFLWKFAINLNDKTKKKSCYINDFYYCITTVGEGGGDISQSSKEFTTVRLQRMIKFILR